MIRIPRALFQNMTELAMEEKPIECCGLLAGKDGVVMRIYPLENQDRSPSSYFAAPEQELHALTEMGDFGLDLLAIYHSHPDTESYPSPMDIEKAAFTEVAYIIISLKEQTPRVRAFRITPSGEITEEHMETF